ncbi:MAG: GAF domain-containing protein [Thermoplasmata archaeon]
MAEREEIGETQILASLLGVAEMICGLTDTDELIALIARVTPGLVRVDRCAIMAYDEASREFRTLASFAPGARRTPFDGLRMQESEIPWLAQRLIALRLPALLKAASGEAGLSPALQQRLAMKSALVVPLAARGRFLGLLWLDDTKNPHYFTSEEINIVQGVGAQLAIALNLGNLAEQLDLERRRTEALVTALVDGLIVVDREMRIVTIDPGAEVLIGWQTSEVRGRRMYEVFEISEAEASVAWTMEKSGPAPAPKELQLRARDGHRVTCWVQGTAVRGPEGDVVQILYALRKRPGTKGYADRVIDSMDGLAHLQAAEPPE